MADDLVLFGAIGAVAIIGGYGLLYLYCDGKKGSSFCKFPCEPIIGQCSEKTVRVRKGEKV